MVNKMWQKLAGRCRTYWRYYDPQRRKCIKLASSKDGKTRLCAHCEKFKQPYDCQVDHIVPIGKGPKTLIEFVRWLKKLCCPVKNLQVLCKPCHKKKTKKERKKK